MYLLYGMWRWLYNHSVIGFLLRTLWRLLILIVGSICLWAVIFLVVPIADSRLPTFVSLLIAYILLTYIAVPNLIRLLRIFIKPNHIPLYVTTGDGWPSDPVNIAIVCKNRAALTCAMKMAGWYEADPMNFRTALRGLYSFAANAPYAEAPLSTLYLFNRKHDIGFEIPTNRAMSMRTRHHVRFWKLAAPRHASPDKHPHVSFWQQQLQTVFGLKEEIWVGAAVEETIPLAIQWHTGRLTHGGSHDSDRERDYIIQTLKDKKLVKKISQTDAGEPIQFRGQQFRTIYITDGSLKVVQLR